jgi:hypothetical protein
MFDFERRADIKEKAAIVTGGAPPESCPVQLRNDPELLIDSLHSG